MRRWVGLAAALIAAMAVGRVITDTLPLDDAVDKPFVHTGTVGHAVKLTYAEVTAERPRVARSIVGVEPVKAAGRFLVVDLVLRATREPTFFSGVEVVDAKGRRYAPMDRGTSCPTTTTAPTGVRWYAMFCFDVPRTALAGAKVVVARGEYGTDGADQRRDDLASIDLGIDRSDADRLWSGDLAYRSQTPGFEATDTTPVKVEGSP
jgi:hypothetical protein